MDAMRMRRNYVDGHLEAFQESGSSDYSPKTDETIAEICRSGQYNGEERLQAASFKLPDVTATLAIFAVQTRL